MVWIKKLAVTTVFGSLFFSMMLSFLVSLSSNVNYIDVTAGFCPSTHQQVIVLDQDEQELAKKHKILIEKNVIATERIKVVYEAIGFTVLSPEVPHFFELTNDIFFPPKTPAV